MTAQASCPRCRYANPPENRFCGSCGASLGTGSDLVARREGNLTVMGRALSVKPGARRQGACGRVGYASRAGGAFLATPQDYTTVEECEATAWAIAPDDGRYQGAEAVNAVVACALGVRVPPLLYSLPGMKQLQDFTYYLVASNRSRLPGDRSYCGQHPAECQ